MKESVNNQVLFDKVHNALDLQNLKVMLAVLSHWPSMSADHNANAQATYDKLQSEVPKYKMITTSILSDRLRVSFHFLPAGLLAWGRMPTTDGHLWKLWLCCNRSLDSPLQWILQTFMYSHHKTEAVAPYHDQTHVIGLSGVFAARSNLFKLATMSVLAKPEQSLTVSSLEMDLR